MQARVFRSKLKAAGVHFSLSLVAFSPVLYLILTRWYPQPWFPIDGGWQGVRIMIWVDLVLGPALTFLVYNAAKSRRALAVDFSTIGIVQICAFIWGVYAVHGQRPVGVAYYAGGFYSFEEKPLLRQGRTAADLKKIDAREPALLFAEDPKTREQREKWFADYERYELATFELFDFMQPIAGHLEQVWERSDALAAVLWADEKQAARLERILKKHPGLRREDLRFAWFIGRYEDATLVMSPAGDVLGSVAYVEPKKSSSNAPAKPAT